MFHFDLGNYELVVGSNNRSTTFSGLISGTGYSGSAMVKIGTGNLTLTNENIFSGATTVEDGVLTIDSQSGSGTGSGAVFVNNGTFINRSPLSA